MSVTSVNQVRQLYVANKVVDKGTKLSANGDMIVKTCDEFDKEVYFEVKGYDTVLKSDRIPVKNISYAKAIEAAKMKTPMKKVLVTLKSTVNEGLPIAGEDYILRINLRQFYGMSDQDQYFKDAAVHATKGMSKETFYAEMKKALDRCFAREVGATIDSNPYLSFTSSEAGLVIEEKAQTPSWHLGTAAEERVFFDVVPTTVYDGIDDLIWGDATEQTPTNFVDNGRKIADLEYFLLGERGDQYRKIGWPNDIETKGLVDPNKSYDVFEIHYAFTDTGVNSYRTEKDITIVVPSEGEATFTVINKLIGDFNAATGLSVETLPKNKDAKVVNSGEESHTMDDTIVPGEE